MARWAIKPDPVTVDELIKNLKNGRKLGLPKDPIDKDRPNYYVKPIERDDVLTRAIRANQEFCDRLMELNRDEMFLYMFIAEFIMRYHVPPTLAEMIMYIEKFKVYGAPFGDTINGKFEAMNDLKKVTKINRVMTMLMKKGWLIWDPKLPGGMILLGRNAFIRELEKDYPIDTNPII